jgi:hypothetical protein
MTPIGAAALALAGKGMRVFPCNERGKEPALSGGFNRATTDLNVISGWWRARNFNIGVATGEGSGLWVLDVDGEEGEATLRDLEAEHGALPPTVEAITGKGRHLYFRWPTGSEIRSKQDNPVLPEIDVRGDGGYVLAPPSLHPSGRCYAWSVDTSDEFADAPDWLIVLVTSKVHPAEASFATINNTNTWRSFISEPVEGSHRRHAVARFYGRLVRRFVDPIVALDIARMFNALRRKPPARRRSAMRTLCGARRSAPTVSLSGGRFLREPPRRQRVDRCSDPSIQSVATAVTFTDFPMY